MDHPAYQISTQPHLHVCVGFAMKIKKKNLKNLTNLKVTTQPASSAATHFLQILQWLSYPIP